MDQLKAVETAGLGEASKVLEPETSDLSVRRQRDQDEAKIRRAHVQATDAIAKVKIMRVQQEKQSEQRAWGLGTFGRSVRPGGRPGIGEARVT
ncbi:Uncharacterized protein (Fragment) [Durusdinium trenchii]|uniref:Uncharacterized protein n=1 Tax=Durusdinium trenchii TaxID=1381693 RepID=A0ABP0PSD6_9DINO